MSRSALALCLLAAVCGAAPQSRLRGPTRAIRECTVSGEPVDISQFPWQVSLENSSPKHICSGSIIGPTWVLTIAQCTTDYTPQRLFVRAGSSFRETGGTTYGVANIIQHEDFSHYSMDYDIALLEISEPIAFGSNVQAVILGTTELPSGTEVNITGWGPASLGGSRPQQLHASNTTIVDRKSCRAVYASMDYITEHMICAGQEEDSCVRDSGGPLVVGNTQYGVESWGLKEFALSGNPSILSSVPAFRSWIKEKSGI